MKYIYKSNRRDKNITKNIEYIQNIINQLDLIFIKPYTQELKNRYYFIILKGTFKIIG